MDNRPSISGQTTDEEIANLQARLGAYYQSGPYRLSLAADDIIANAVANGESNPPFLDIVVGMIGAGQGPEPDVRLMPLSD